MPEKEIALIPEVIYAEIEYPDWLEYLEVEVDGTRIVFVDKTKEGDAI